MGAMLAISHVCELCCFSLVVFVWAVAGNRHVSSPDLCIDMHEDMGIDTRIVHDMCIDMCIDICVDMCIVYDICMDTCIVHGTCIDMCIDMYIDMVRLGLLIPLLCACACMLMRVYARTHACTVVYAHTVHGIRVGASLLGPLKVHARTHARTHACTDEYAAQVYMISVNIVQGVAVVSAWWLIIASRSYEVQARMASNH